MGGWLERGGAGADFAKTLGERVFARQGFAAKCVTAGVLRFSGADKIWQVCITLNYAMPAPALRLSWRVLHNFPMLCNRYDRLAASPAGYLIGFGVGILEVFGELFGCDTGLFQCASKRAESKFAVHRNHASDCAIRQDLFHDNMAAALACLEKSHALQGLDGLRSRNPLQLTHVVLQRWSSMDDRFPEVETLRDKARWLP